MRGPIAWLLAATLMLVPLAASAGEWDSRDVEAAERYRENERERASRYREDVSRRSREAARAPRIEYVPTPSRTPQPTASTTSWRDSLLRAGVAEEDLRTLTGWIDGLDEWASLWQSPLPFVEALGAKLVHGVLAEVRREAQSD